jgi:hypothetical protein
LEEKEMKKRHTTTPKANAAITSSVDTDAVDNSDLVSLGICGKPHWL